MGRLAVLPALLEGLAGDDVVFLAADAATVSEEVLADAGFFVPTYMGDARNLGLMARMPNLEVCQLLTAGFDSALAHLPRSVTLCNAAGVHDASTAELAIGLMLASLRGIDEAARAASEGRWIHRARPALADSQVLILGAGGVAQAVRRRLAGFEVGITMVGRTAREGVLSINDIASVLPMADVVVVAVPLDDSTRRLVDAVFLGQMKDGALLVNVARGGVVDTDALLAECSSGRLVAALDVTDPEPLPPDHPLWQCTGVLITPHVGGNTSAFLPRAERLVREQLQRWRTGQPLLNRIPVPV